MKPSLRPASAAGLALTAMALLALVLLSTVSDISSTAYANRGTVANRQVNTTDYAEPPACGGVPDVVVAKLVTGADIDDINARYRTTVLRHFPGTTIYVLTNYSNQSTEHMAARIQRNKQVAWAEAGMFGTGARGAAPTDAEGFGLAAVDGFTQAAIDGFTNAAIEGFTLAAIDHFSQTADGGFTSAAIEGFTLAAIDYFSQTAGDGFTSAAIEGFTLAAIDGFVATVSDGFTPAAIDGFTFAAADAFTQASIDGFTLSAIDAFAVAVQDAFSEAAAATITEAVLSGFTQAAIDGFTLTALEGFTLAAQDGSMTAGLDAFTQSILSGFDSAYFEALLLEALDATYGETARNQPALANINASAAHQHSTGAGTLVAVIDSGISDHWYLRDRVAPGGWDFVDGDSDPTEEANGRDDDGNGLVDEGVGHGTHVAGIVSLVAPDARILPIRVQDSDGRGWSFMLAEAIQYAVDSGADVINVSLQVPCHSLVLEWAIDYAYERGAAVVASAGNENGLATGYPVRFEDTVAVAALNDDGTRAAFSNYGPVVDLAAPGVDIYSTYPGGQFATWSGTSQAAPMVSGELALLASRYPWLLVNEMVDIVARETTDISTLNTEHVGGLIDLLRTVESNPEAHEFLVNSVTFHEQLTSPGGQQAVAMDTLGNFVVVWSSEGQDGSRWGVYAQRFNTAGVPQGPALQVNTYARREQYDPSVAMDRQGNFVIVYSSYGQDGSGYGVFARLFDASGAPLGPEFQVNTHERSDQLEPSVAMSPEGDFVVTWSNFRQDGSSYGVYARRFDAAGSPLGGEFQVNTHAKHEQWRSTVAMDDLGGFVVAWQGSGRGGTPHSIHARLYGPAGSPLGDEFRVSLDSTSGEAPKLAMDSDGDFVIAWTDDSGRVYARDYTSAGMPRTDAFRVDGAPGGGGKDPTVAMDAAGSYTVAWSGYGQDAGRTYGIRARAYAAAGAPRGSEFQVNPTADGDQEYPSVAMSSAGGFVVVWSGNGPGDGDGVFGRQFADPID